MHTQAAIARAIPTAENATLFHRIWPAAVVLFGFGLNAAWVALLGYGIVSILKLAL